MVEALRRENEYELNGPHDRENDAGPPNNVTNIADRAKQQAVQGLEKAGEELERGKVEIAKVMDATAQRLESMEGAPGGTTTRARHKVADGLESASTYLHGHDRNEIRRDIEAYARKHPVQTMVGLIAAGFVIGRMMR